MVEKEKRTECYKHKWIPLLGIDKKKSVPTSLFTCLRCGDLKVGVQTIKISQFRLDMGGLPINSVAGVNLINGSSVDTLPTSGPASGLIITANVTTNSQGIGAPLYVDISGNLIEANALSSATSPCVALAVDTGTGANKRVLVHGILRLSAWNWATGPGTLSLVYVSTTTGTLTQNKTEFSGTDRVIQPVGWALSADSIYFAPSMIYLTHV
ncbi:MAG: hypothetical protein NTX96_02240 [Candidatus Zambryskibacteria bacterium]|nr:hypothetical protein [Candidatus Zambryskibacteria bacterium]